MTLSVIQNEVFLLTSSKRIEFDMVGALGKMLCIYDRIFCTYTNTLITFDMAQALGRGVGSYNAQHTSHADMVGTLERTIFYRLKTNLITILYVILSMARSEQGLCADDCVA